MRFCINKNYIIFQVTSLVSKSLSSSRDASFITKVTLQGVLSDLSLGSLRLRVLRQLLKSLFKNEVHESNANDVIAQVLLHLDQEPKLTASQLAQLISICLDELKNNQPLLQSQWLPILSKLFSLCLDQDKMLELVDEREVTGAEFRQDKIRYTLHKQ